MKKKYKRLLIIPARTGSKRIKNKNFLDFYGKPIIQYSLNTAQKSKLFDIIFVSTDSTKVKKYLNNENITVDYKRPKKLSGDKAKIIDLIFFIVKKFENENVNFKEVWIMMPCVPCIESSDLIKASKLLSKEKTCFTTVTENLMSPYWSYHIKKKKIEPLFKKAISKRSQNIKKTYFETGLFAGWDLNYFSKNNKLKNYKFSPIILPLFKSIDVDTIEDLKLLKFFYKHRNELKYA